MSSIVARNSPTNMQEWSRIAYNGIIPEGCELIRDTMPLKIVDMQRNVLSESISGEKIRVMRCTGVFQRADVKNENGRIYPYETLKQAIEDMQEAITARRIMGEFDHPPDAKIHLDRVSHLITKLWMDGKTVYGEIEILNDSRCPCGSQLACLLDRDVQVGVSSRGVGDMEITMTEAGEEAYEVQPGFAFVTFDAVAEPSVTGTQLMMMESRQRKLKTFAEDKVAQEIELLNAFRNHLFN